MNRDWDMIEGWLDISGGAGFTITTTFGVPPFKAWAGVTFG